MPGRISQFTPDEYRAPISSKPSSGAKAIRSRATSFLIAARPPAPRVQAVSTLAALARGSMPSKPHYRPRRRPRPSRRPWSNLPLRCRVRAPLRRGTLVVNPLSFARSIGSEVSAGVPAHFTAEVPGMGFACLERPTTPKPSGRARPIAQGNVLANEFFEAHAGCATGGIASIHVRGHRGNLLSQQLAFRLPDPPGASAEGTYATMRGEAIDAALTSAEVGEVVSRGSIVDADGKRWAGFRQTTTVWAGSRTARLAIELLDVEEPVRRSLELVLRRALRMVRRDGHAARGVGLAHQATDATRFEAPEYITIENGSRRVAILTGGVPYHRRAGSRMLDTLLVVRGETARRFELAIGVDVPQPAAAALDFVTPATLVEGDFSAPASVSGWFFHLDSKNVVATHWQPIADDGDAADAVRGRSCAAFVFGCSRRPDGRAA